MKNDTPQTDQTNQNNTSEPLNHHPSDSTPTPEKDQKKRNTIIIVTATIIVIVAIAITLTAFLLMREKPNDSSSNSSSEGNSQQDDNDPIDYPEEGENNDPANETTQIDKIAAELYEKGNYLVEGRWAYGSACDFIPHLDGDSIREIRVRPLETSTIDGEEYYKTTLPYQETIDKHFGETFTGDALNRFVAHRYVDIDGVLYCSDRGGATFTTIKNLKVSLQAEINGSYEYLASYNVTSGSEGEETTPEAYTDKFTIQKTGETYKISSIDSLTYNDHFAS